MDAQVAKGPQPATYEAGYGLEIASNKVRQIRESGAGSLVLRIILFVVALGGAVILALVFWPLGILGLIGAFAALRKKPEVPMFVGLWHGICPRCESEIWIHGPPKAEDMPFSCPACTRHLVLRQSSFVAE